jgi:dihydrofolate reductase
MGSAMVMGRRTFDSLPGLLPGRRHIVLTRDPRWQAEGAEVARSAEQALEMAGEERVSVIGGAEIFAMFLRAASRIELTEVHSDIEGDTLIDDPRSSGGWREVAREDYPAESGRPAFSFVTVERG